MLTSAKGSFLFLDAHTATPKYFWNGVVLTEVRRMVVHHDEDTIHVKLRVENTATFDAQYAEMEAAGIKVKKGGL